MQTIDQNKETVRGLMMGLLAGGFFWIVYGLCVLGYTTTWMANVCPGHPAWSFTHSALVVVKGPIDIQPMNDACRN